MEKKKSSISASDLDWMPKAIWGPIKWSELHARALAYLPMAGEQAWFDDFVRGLPCPKCRRHFEVFLEDNPPDLSSRPAFFAWTVQAHNYVNRSKKRPELTLEEALAVHAKGILMVEKPGASD